jgi:ribonuclease HI
MNARRVTLFTDGACSGNPGPGGWGTILIWGNHRKLLSGGEPETTNNRMELTAVIEALRAVPAEAGVRVVTDSQYVMNGITRWLAGWRKRGWRTATGSAVLNRDLWEALAALVGPRVTWEWVRGHAGHAGNERVDALARAQAREYARARPPGAAAAARRAPSGADAAPGRSARGTAAGGPRPTYLSLVDGHLRRHADWPACQDAVHRRAGARYKKCSGADEERATVARWGLTPAALAALDGAETSSAAGERG